MPSRTYDNHKEEYIDPYKYPGKVFGRRSFKGGFKKQYDGVRLDGWYYYYDEDGNFLGPRRREEDDPLAYDKKLGWGYKEKDKKRREERKKNAAKFKDTGGFDPADPVSRECVNNDLSQPVLYWFKEAKEQQSESEKFRAQHEQEYEFQQWPHHCAPLAEPEYLNPAESSYKWKMPLGFFHGVCVKYPLPNPSSQEKNKPLFEQKCIEVYSSAMPD